MEIIVEGNATLSITPDLVILNLSFKTKAHTYEEALGKGIEEVQNFVDEVLLKNNFTVDDMKTQNFVIKEEQKYNEQTESYIFDGYSFYQNATIKFDYDKVRLAKVIEGIAKLEKAPSIQVNFGVKNEKAYQEKVLQDAYQDAQFQAEAIAKAAGKVLDQCKKVDFKPFTEEYISKTRLMDSFENANTLNAIPKMINIFTPEDIKITENLYCLWITK